MAKPKKLPSPLTILFCVIILAAVATWLMPAGEYDTLSYGNGKFTVSSVKGDKIVPCNQHTLDSLKILVKLDKFKNGDIFKPVAIPGTYHSLKRNGQGFIAIITAPVQGLVDSSDIIFFLLFIGGFIMVFQETGSLEKGVAWLSYKMKGQEAWLIILLTFFFLFCGSAEGMAEEGFAFYPILVPLYLAAGYDLLVPLAVIFAGTSIGNITSFSNPFATIIASNAAGINWTDGLYERIGAFAVTSAVTIWYIVRYAQKVKNNPALSLVRRIDGEVHSTFDDVQIDSHQPVKLSIVDGWLNIQFLATIGIMIYGFVKGMDANGFCTAIFLVSAIIIAIIVRMKESVFIKKFIQGAESLLGVCLMIGVARGITFVLNNGHVTGTILYYSSGVVSKMPMVLFILVLIVMFMIFTLVISSSSGMAVLTMPIFGSLALIVGVPGREIVNAYLFGMGIMGLITPVGLMLPSLAAVNISLKTWLRFSWPLILMLIAVCSVFLVFGVMNR